MGKQIDYPADTVGVDGTVYPTVGENIRHLWNNTKIITLTLTYDGTKFTEAKSSVPIKITSNHSVAVTCKQLALLSVAALKNDVEFNNFYMHITPTSTTLGIVSTYTKENTFKVMVMISE